MNSKKYDVVVYIGRFQPLHNGHVKTIQQISQLANKVVVLVGSVNTPQTIKNPFTFDERKQLIKDSTHVMSMEVLPIKDYTYDDPKWIRQVVDTVNEASRPLFTAKPNAKIAIAGFDKDETSMYLNYFPQWDLVEVPEYKDYGNTLHATDIRELYFTKKFNLIGPTVSPAVFDFMMEFVNTNSKAFNNLVDEYDYIEDYKKSWASTPYEVNFTTTDAIVVQSGHVLLIERKFAPGKGLWALPGGFLNPNERIVNGVIRELREETKVKVPEKVLRGNIHEVKVFDDPKRSSRGRTVTHAHLIKLDDNNALPDIRGNDDAKEARWVPLDEFYGMADRMFEDHWHVIENMINRL